MLVDQALKFHATVGFDLGFIGTVNRTDHTATAALQQSHTTTVPYFNSAILQKSALLQHCHSVAIRKFSFPHIFSHIHFLALLSFALPSHKNFSNSCFLSFFAFQLSFKVLSNKFSFLCLRVSKSPQAGNPHFNSEGRRTASRFDLLP